jgi:membrane associated rhomboid family serine protease
MRNLRKKFDIFCFKNRDKGVPNLMLYLCLGTAVVYLFSSFTQNYIIYDLFAFDRALILQGQVWRLFTYVLLTYRGNVMLQLLYLVCYYSLGKAMENYWGTCKFNLFYLTGVLLMDVYCMIFGGYADVYYLNLSLFLSYATLYPDTHFLLFFIIPVKAWIFALLDIVLTLVEVVSMSIPVFLFPYNLFPLVAIANYALFFGKDVLNVVPMAWKANSRRLFKKKTKAAGGAKVVQFPKAGSYEASVAKPKAPYTHKCTVCGRTDVDSPELEFRYCSRCMGYHCYCEDHISNHTHVE